MMLLGGHWSLLAASSEQIPEAAAGSTAKPFCSPMASPFGISWRWKPPPAAPWASRRRGAPPPAVAGSSLAVPSGALEVEAAAGPAATPPRTRTQMSSRRMVGKLARPSVSQPPGTAGGQDAGRVCCATTATSTGGSVAARVPSTSGGSGEPDLASERLGRGGRAVRGEAQGPDAPAGGQPTVAGERHVSHAVGQAGARDRDLQVRLQRPGGGDALPEPEGRPQVAVLASGNLPPFAVSLPGTHARRHVHLAAAL